MNIKKYLENILINCDINCGVEEDIYNKTASMSYSILKNIIYYNVKGLEEAKLSIRFFEKIEFLDMIEIIFAHEIGHCIDIHYRNNTPLTLLSACSLMEYSDAHIESERLAWDYGKKYISDCLINVYDDIAIRCLESLKTK